MINSDLAPLWETELWNNYVWYNYEINKQKHSFPCYRETATCEQICPEDLHVGGKFSLGTTGSNCACIGLAGLVCAENWTLSLCLYELFLLRIPQSNICLVIFFSTYTKYYLKYLRVWPSFNGSTSLDHSLDSILTRSWLAMMACPGLGAVFSYLTAALFHKNWKLQSANTGVIKLFFTLHTVHCLCGTSAKQPCY